MAPQMAQIRITGLQIAAPDERAVIVSGRPLRVQLELYRTVDGASGAHQQQGEADREAPLLCQVAMDFADIQGNSVLNRSAPVSLPAGSSWIEMRLPPDSLALGRYSLSVAVPGHDLHRSRRLVDVLEVPPPVPPEQQERYGQWSLMEGQLPRDPGVWRVEQLRIQTPAGEPAVIRPGEPMEVLMRLNTAGLPPDPLVRLQIFSQSGELVLGTNTVRWGLRLGQGPPRTLRASFAQLNLEPGHYHATVGLWQDEWSTEAYQARHGYYEFLVQPPATALLRGSFELESTEDHGAPANPELVGPATVQQGGELCVRLAPARPGAGRAWFEQQGRERAAAVTPQLVTGPGTTILWKLRALLPAGEYFLCYTQWNVREAIAEGEVFRFAVQILQSSSMATEPQRMTEVEANPAPGGYPH